MKIILTTITAVFLFTGAAFSQPILTVRITGLRNNTGKLMIQLFDEKENVTDRQIADISDRQGQVIFTVQKPGKYAVRFYHDENMNREMETNLVGKPTEGYGFSNNVTGKFGMPPFEKWLFDINENKTITINAVY